MAKASLVVQGMPDAKNMRRIFHRTTFGIAQEAAVSSRPVMVQALKAPAQVARPIEWASEKQRKAFYATDGFGGGIPHRRTGSIEAGNRLYAVQQPDGATIILENINPKSKYVYRGFNQSTNRQQPMHRNSGWPSMLTARNKVFASVREHVRENFKQTLLAFGLLQFNGQRQEF